MKSLWAKAKSLVIPSGVEHQAEVLDDTFEIDFFSPARHDWLGANLTQ